MFLNILPYVKMTFQLHRGQMRRICYLFQSITLALFVFVSLLQCGLCEVVFAGHAEDESRCNECTVQTNYRPHYTAPEWVIAQFYWNNNILISGVFSEMGVSVVWIWVLMESHVFLIQGPFIPLRQELCMWFNYVIFNCMYLIKGFNYLGSDLVYEFSLYVR